MFSANESDVPVQLYQLASDGVQCYRELPADRLRPYIYYYWLLRVMPGNTVLEVIPDNAIDLVMCPDITRFSILYMPASESFSIPLTGPITYVGISFRAETAAQFFDLDQVSMRSCLPGEDTTESLSVESIVEGVKHIDQPEQLAEILDELTSERLGKAPVVCEHSAKLNMNKVLAAMQASVGVNGMRSIAERFDLSDRHFRRVMGSLFGYSPKKVQRVMRLQASLKELLADNPWALEDGFFDEAHKIKEIRALTGQTPGQIRKMAEIYNSI